MRRCSLMGWFAVVVMACGDDGTATTDPGDSSSSSSVTTPDDTTETSVTAESSSGSSVDTTSGDTTSGDTTASDSSSAGSSSSGGDSSTGTDGTSTSSGSSEESTSALTASESTSDDESESDNSVGFIEDPDGGVSQECDVWAQDCPEGEKCNAWANDGGGSWNALGCFPIAMDPVGPGEQCTVEDSGVSGIDNCDIGSMCWGVDTETNIGTCVALCTGSPVMPMCADAGTQCVMANDGVLNLCLPFCDPLSQTCEVGDACYPIGLGFSCAPDASADEGVYGDLCEFINVCDPMLFCASADTVPGCMGTGCCSEFCDVTDPNASMNCAGAAGGQECIPWFEEGQAPPGLEDVGACAIPV